MYKRQDVKGEDTETLNHFDEHTRYQFTRMLFAYGTGTVSYTHLDVYKRQNILHRIESDILLW